MADMSHCYHHTKYLAEREMHQVQSQAVASRKSVIRFTGKQVLPSFLEPLFHSCLDPATLEDLKVFTVACIEYKNEMNHAATNIRVHSEFHKQHPLPSIVGSSIQYRNQDC